MRGFGVGVSLFVGVCLFLVAAVVRADSVFHLNLRSSLPAGEVELIRSRPAIAEYVGETLRFDEWVSIDDKSVLGLLPDGRLIHVLKLEDQKIGFVLNWNQPFTSFYVTQAGHILGLNAEGKLFQFDSNLWRKVPWRSILGRYGSLAAGAHAAIFGGWWLVNWMAGVPGPSGYELTLIGGMASTSVMGMSAWLGSLEFMRQIFLTNGFFEIHEFNAKLRSWSPVWEGEEIRDYQLNFDSGAVFLGEILNSSNSRFKPELAFDLGLRCEHALIPRGKPFLQ